MPNLADRLGVMYAERAIARAQICLLVFDATEGVTTEDASIGAKINKAGRGAVIVFNKWDLVTGREEVIDVSRLDVSNNGIELQDREFVAAIREGREPNASVAKVLECYRVMDELERQLNNSN